MPKSKQRKTKPIQWVTARAAGGKKQPPIYSDVNGSYTGRPVDGGKPMQDADDL